MANRYKLIHTGNILTEVNWIPLGTATYEGADDPTYTFSFASDVTGVLSAGMKIKLTQSTGGTKYCFITGVGAYSGGKTIITGYFGTDYNLENEAITAPYYSTQKAPFGFPLDPIKWKVETTDSSSREQASPTTETWYNLGSLSLAVPIGCWNLSYQVNLEGSNGPAESAIFVEATLSTANNTESDSELTSLVRFEGASGDLTIGNQVSKNKLIALTSKATYYLNAYTPFALDSMQFRGSASAGGGKTIIRAVCAYL